MKAFKYIMILAIAALSTSCKKWLDVKPSSELDRSDLFSSENGYMEALTGVYANLTKPALYGRELTWGTLDVAAGVYFPGITGEYLTILNYQYKRANSNYILSAATVTDNIWDNMYTQIANLNSILQTIDANKQVFSGDNYSIIKGEALGLRAFLHFELLRMYGPSYASVNGAATVAIPFVSELNTKVAPLLTVDNAMSFIIDDLKKAKGLMANDPIHLGTAPSSVLAPLPDGNYAAYGISVWHNRRFSFNYYAAAATLARAYLWKGDKNNALLSAKEVIDAQKTKFPWVRSANVSTIGGTAVNQDRTFATEHVFALNIRNINDYMDGYTYFGTSSMTYSNLYPFAFLSFGNIFEGSSDYRQIYLGVSYNGNKYSSKFYQISSVLNGFKQRVPLIRISEMYYIASECETDVLQAKSYLDSVRANRGLSSMPLSASITKVQLDNEIRKEYQKEFISEGQLWYYQKRKDLDLADFSVGMSLYNVYYFTNKNQYVFDRPEDEDGNR